MSLPSITARTEPPFDKSIVASPSKNKGKLPLTKPGKVGFGPRSKSILIVPLYMNMVSPDTGTPVGDQSLGLLALLLPPPIHVLVATTVPPFGLICAIFFGRLAV